MRAAWLLGIPGILAACSLVLPGVDELSGGGSPSDASTGGSSGTASGGIGGDGGGQAGSGGGQAGASGGVGGQAGAAGAGGQAGAPSCPGSAGPAMVNVGAYCIDTTEVTAAQYAEFLAAPPTPSQSGDLYCAVNNTEYTPSTWPNGSIDDRPVVWLDWCDAHDYCVWAGKRLCAGIGGASVTYEAPLDPTVHEWFNACTNDGTTPVPYGSAPVANACNVETAGLSAVKSFAACHGKGKFAPIYDQVGNAREWVGVCGGAEWCQALGGGYPNSGNTCDDTSQHPKLSVDYDLGFRCCADVP